MYKIQFQNDWERDTWESVCLANEYQIPSSITGWTVIDLGFHLGSFADLCIRRGATRIVGVEANPATFHRAENCFRDTPEVRLHHRAIWSETGKILSMMQDPRLLNTGGNQVLDEETEGNRVDALKQVDNWDQRFQSNVVESITIQDLLEWEGVDTVDFLKVDVEGAEVHVFDSLKNDPETFKRIARVAVEWHGKERKQHVLEILTDEGFEVEDDAPSPDQAFGQVGFLYGERV